MICGGLAYNGVVGIINRYIPNIDAYTSVLPAIPLITNFISGIYEIARQRAKE